MDKSLGHIIVLVAVLNVMGLANIMGGLALYFRKSHELKVKREPILMIWVGLHLYFHIMMWWRLYGIEVVDAIPYLRDLDTWASPFDSHPNARAHAVLADVLYERLSGSM